MKGSAGLEIRGLRPSKQAHKYQSEIAAGLSQNPTMRKIDMSAPNMSTKLRKMGWSQTASILGNRRISGLVAATGKAPRLENISEPHGRSVKKGSRTQRPRTMRKILYCPPPHP